jgi:putative membrane protein insertion efficiency factor
VTLRRLPAAAVVALLRAYQRLVSPWLRTTCRFEPSCSEYAVESVRRHGALAGALHAARRLARCRPFGGGGYDPPPR